MRCQCPYCKFSHNIKSIRFPSYVKYSPLDNTNDTLTACIRHSDLGSLTIHFTNKYDMIRPSNIVSATMHAQRALCKNKQFKNAHDHWFLNVDGVDVSIADLERKNVQFTTNTHTLSTENLGECTAPLLRTYKVNLKFRGKQKYEEMKHVDTSSITKISCDKRQRLGDESINDLKSIKVESSKSEEKLVLEDEEEEPFLWTTKEDYWTSENLQYFIGLHPQSCPKLLRIEQETYPIMSKKKCIPIYECVFEHPVTYSEKTIWMSSSIMIMIKQYKEMLEQFKSSTMVCE